MHCSPLLVSQRDEAWSLNLFPFLSYCCRQPKYVNQPSESDNLILYNFLYDSVVSAGTTSGSNTSTDSAAQNSAHKNSQPDISVENLPRVELIARKTEESSECGLLLYNCTVQRGCPLYLAPSSPQSKLVVISTMKS